jgi:hypothetical protein
MGLPRSCQLVLRTVVLEEQPKRDLSSEDILPRVEEVPQFIHRRLHLQKWETHFVASVHIDNNVISY